MTHIYKSNMLGKSMSTVVGACLVMAMSFFATNNANAQVTPIWTIDAPTSNWFGTGNTERGLTYNPATGNLLVASRQSGGIVILDPATGDSLGSLDLTGISGGTFSYNQIRATDDGQLFTANLTLNGSTTNLKIYRWADESSAPTNIFDATTTSADRFGDALGAFGSGTSVTLLVGGGGGDNTLLAFSWDGATLTKDAEYTVTTNLVRGGYSHHVDGDSVASAGTNATPRMINLTDGVEGPYFKVAGIDSADFASVMYIDFADISGTRYFAAGPAFTNGKFYFLREDGDSLRIVQELDPLGGGVNANGNNTGGAIIDDANNRLYLMDTNNQLAVYNLNDFLYTESTVANARGNSGADVILTGIVNSNDYGFNDSQFYIQDETGGINVFYNDQGINTIGDYAVSAGDEVTIYGTIGAFNSQVQISADDVVINSSDNDIPEAVEIAASALSVDSNQGERIRIKDLMLVDAGEWPTVPISSGSGVTIRAYQEGTTDTVSIRIDRGESALDGIPAPDGKFTLEGVAARFNDEAQILPFFESDLIIGGPVNVTFRVNMATAPDTVNGDNYSVFVNGTIKGAGEGQAFVGGETITWDASATATLENVGGDYWEGTYQMLAGDTLLWKYRYQNDVTNISDDENAFSTVGNPAGWDTRGVVITEDTILDVAYYNDRGDAPAQDFFPFESLQPDTIAVWFRVNVGLLVQEGKFDAATDTIEVRGGQLPLTWDSGTGVKLSAEAAGTGDNVFFSGVGYFNQDSLDTYMPDGNPARTLKYKFYATGPNAQVDWESTPDRFVTITSMADTTLHYKFFNDAPPTQEKIVDTKLNFGVNVGILEGLGYFNSGLGDSVKVRGFFNSWGQQAMAFNAFAKIWEAKGIDFSSAVGAEGTYKYYIDWDDSRFDDSSPNYIAAIDDPNDTNRDVGYEEPGITGGGNRVFTLVDAPEQEQQEHFFNSMEPEARMDETNVDGGAISVTFSVDMNPAEQRSSSPFNPSTDSVYIVFETPFFAISQGFVKGGGMFSSANTAADIEDRRLTDSDGDGVYEVTIDLQLPTLNHFGFYIAYGRPFAADGTIIDNSEGFDAGRRYYQYVQPQVDANLNVTWPSTATFPTLVWKDDNLPFELPPDYGTVSNEEELGTVETFSLEQNYPNPFNPTTNIRFNLPNAADVTLTVYNVLGQKVATLLNNKKFTVGSHDVAFDARNLASGVYIYRIEAGSFTKSKKMMLIK